MFHVKHENRKEKANCFAFLGSEPQMLSERPSRTKRYKANCFAFLGLEPEALSQSDR